MRQWVVGVAVIPTLLSGFWITSARGQDFLEMAFDRDEDGSTDLYDIAMWAGKDGAATWELVTPLGTYSCIDVGDGFVPEQAFVDDHSGMSLAELHAVTSAAWTLTWDAGPGQTVATIDFGTPVLETEFLPVPTFTFPLDGEDVETLTPTIEWTYAPLDPCEAQGEEIEVTITNQAGTEMFDSDGLVCDDTSWTQPTPLTPGIWHFRIINAISNYRDVPDGITIVEGDWPISNGDWLSLRSIDRSQNLVIDPTVPTEPASWSRLKNLYTAGDN